MTDATATISLCPQREALLDAGGHLLVRGGPGSGKTTIALLKADAEVRQNKLEAEQQALFLSFARATTARVMEQARAVVQRSTLGSLVVNTYHGFAWSLIQSYGYLITGRRVLHLLPPPEAAVRLSGMPKSAHHSELRRLLAEEGLLGFDLFAGLAADVLERSPRVAGLVGDNYPLVILDEFQDTNSDEWRMVSALGKYTSIVALADPDQRIYEFRGADPARIAELITLFNPRVFDFGTENNRSSGTDITTYGNDLLAGVHRGKAYKNVRVSRYNYDGGEALISVKYAVLAAISRLVKAHEKGQWSVAVLVSSKRFMLEVSGYLSTTSDRAKAIHHDVLLDPEGPALAATLIAGLLEGAASHEALANRLTADLISHMRGRNGGNPSQADLKLSAALAGYLEVGTIRGSARSGLVDTIKQVATQCMALTPDGNPESDWLAVRRVLLAAQHDKLKLVGEDARFLRLLNRGALLRETLAEQWRLRGDYSDASGIVSAALLQEHFSSSTRSWTGVNLMTIHKSKGKEFDEVVIFEGSRRGRLLRGDATDKDTAQAVLALRVGVTRAKSRVTIVTPDWDPCPLL